MKYLSRKIASCGFLSLTLFFNGCQQEESNPYPDFLTDHQWVYFTTCDETISLHDDGSFAYYCACGSPVGDSDLFDSFTYNAKTSEIVLSPEAEGNIIPVLRQEKSRLLLNSEDTIKEFFDADDPKMACPDMYVGYDPEDYTYDHSSYLALFNRNGTSVTTAPPGYAADSSEYEEYFLTEKLAEDITFFKWTMQIEKADGEESISHNYEELTEEQADELLKTGSSVGYVWYNDQIEIEKIVFADTSVHE